MNFHSAAVTGITESRLPRRNTMRSFNAPAACSRSISSVTGRANFFSKRTSTWYQRGFAGSLPAS